MRRAALLTATTVLVAVAVAGPLPAASSATSVLVDQTTPAGSGNSISSEDASGYHGETADDFTVPAGTQWTVSEVTAKGFNYGGGPSQQVVVRFYADASGLPGTEEFRGASSINTQSGILTVPLTTPALLGPGVHWLSVQIAHVDGTVAEEWFWSNRGALSGNPAAFRDPLGSTCTAWTFRSSCQGGAASPDQLFSLSGTAGPAPNPPPGTSTPTFESLVGLPSSKTCRRSRTLKIRFKRASGATITRAVVKVAGKKKTITGAKLQKPVKLRGLPAGTYVVKISLNLSTGATVAGKRTYKTCPKP